MSNYIKQILCKIGQLYLADQAIDAPTLQLVPSSGKSRIPCFDTWASLAIGTADPAPLVLDGKTRAS